MDYSFLLLSKFSVLHQGIRRRVGKDSTPRIGYLSVRHAFHYKKLKPAFKNGEKGTLQNCIGSVQKQGKTRSKKV